MENSEKLLELLQKDRLTTEEQQQINVLVHGDPELSKLYDSYTRISNAVRHNSHPSLEEITEYVFFRNGLSTDNPGIYVLAPLIEEHLRTCNKCEDEFKEVNNEFSETEIFLDDILRKPINPDSKASLFVRGILQKPSSLKFALLTTITILFLSLSAGIILNITKPQYYELAGLSNKSEFSITRGRSTDDFQKGIEAYDDGNYTQAISFFSNDIKLNHNESTIFYTYYILGLVNLQSAQKNSLGLFPSFDKDKVLSSIADLKACIQRNNTETFPDINMNAYYYLAKANLMIGNKKEAILCLKNVINGKGGKMDEAAKILYKLE
jgi:tetratricopeptide (TPR) repeat protein